MPDTPKSKNPHVTIKYFATHCDSLNSKKEKKKNPPRFDVASINVCFQVTPSNLASYAKVPSMSSIDTRSCHVYQSYQTLVLSSMLCL